MVIYAKLLLINLQYQAKINPELIIADIYPKFLALSLPDEISAIMPVTPGITIPALKPPSILETIRSENV